MWGAYVDFVVNMYWPDGAAGLISFTSSSGKYPSGPLNLETVCFAGLEAPFQSLLYGRNILLQRVQTH